MELTDKQLYALIDSDIWSITNLSRIRDNDVRDELLQLGLLSYNRLDDVRKYRHPAETHIWRLTDLGQEVLQKNLGHVLSLLHGSNMIGAAFTHFDHLTIEELPPLLVHSEKRIRLYARRRMEELVDGTD